MLPTRLRVWETSIDNFRDLMQYVFEREIVAPAAESADRSDRKIGKVRLAPERLPDVDVGQVDLDERNGDPSQGVAQGDAGMGEGPRIEHYECDLLVSCSVYAFDQGPFVIALECLQRRTGLPRQPSQPKIDRLQAFTAVDLRFPGPQQVEIGAVQYQEF